MTNGKITQDGTGNVIVKFPAWQLVGVVLAAASVIGGVWISNRDLSHVVASLAMTVAELKLAVDDLKTRPIPEWVPKGLDQLKEEDQRLQWQIDRLETKVFGLNHTERPKLKHSGG